MDFSAFSLGSSPFYEPQPNPWALHLVLPEDWLTAGSDAWVGAWPVDARRRTHGWKIHLSLQEATYERSLQRAAEICVDHAVAFKYVPSMQALTGRNAKNADRAASGKAVTVYPNADDQLEALAVQLDAALGAHAGPYILSDVRFGAGPVHFRYGGFEPLFLERDGRRLAARPSADGTLVEDLRVPYFVEPVGAVVPAVVAGAIREYRTQPPENPLVGYRSLEPIQFSNAGGVYRAADRGGSMTVVKEARRGAGTDANGRHAVHRLQTEHRNLARLSGTGVAPEPLRLFDVLEHTFLEMELIDGQTLADRTVTELPALRGRVPAEVATRYGEESEAVARSLFEAIVVAHQHGVVVGDLHPGNVMVRPDLSVTLIDLEDGRRPSDAGTAPFNALGYRGYEGLDAGQADWFAFSRCVASMFDPSFARDLLAPDHWERTREHIDRAAPPSTSELIDEAAARAGAPGRRRAFAAAGVTSVHDPVDLAAELCIGLQAARRPGRSRRFPGDPRGMTGFATVACGYGLGGVLHAQLRVGEDPEEADLDHVGGAIPFGDRMGLFDGLAGLAAVLERAGRATAAQTAFQQARSLSSSSDDCSLATGIAGVALSAVGFDGAAAAELSKTVARRVRNPDGASARRLDAHPGLLNGWSGVALALALVSRHSRSDELGDVARAALERDCRSISRSSAGTLGLEEPGGNRVFPYLANGTAGLLVAMTTMRREGLITSDDPLWDRHFSDLVRSCSGGAHVFDGLFHGAAGLLVGLRSAVEYCPDAAGQIDELVHRLSRRSFRWRGTTQMAGDGCLRLSSDLATGSAGVLLSLPSVADPLAWIPARTAPVGTSSERG